MIEELNAQERTAILTFQRREYRVELEKLKNQMGLAKFLSDTELQERIRKDAERVSKAIEYFDKQIAEASK